MALELRWQADTIPQSGGAYTLFCFGSPFDSPVSYITSILSVTCPDIPSSDITISGNQAIVTFPSITGSSNKYYEFTVVALKTDGVSTITDTVYAVQGSDYSYTYPDEITMTSDTEVSLNIVNNNRIADPNNMHNAYCYAIDTANGGYVLSAPTYLPLKSFVENGTNDFATYTVPANTTNAEKIFLIQPLYNLSESSIKYLGVSLVHQPPKSIIVENEEVTVTGESGTITQNITTNNMDDSTLSVSSNAAWAVPTLNNKVLSIAYDSNLTSANRVATITITGTSTGGGTRTATITLTQNWMSRIIPEESIIDVTWSPGTITQNITTVNMNDATLTVSDSVNWVTTSLNNKVLTIEYWGNTYASSRSTTITISGTDINGNQRSVQMVLRQKVRPGEIYLDQNAITVPADHRFNHRDVKVSTFLVDSTPAVTGFTASITGDVTGTFSWYNYVDENQNTLRYLIFTPDDNETENTLTGTITVSGTDLNGDTVTASYTVTQRPYNPDLVFNPHRDYYFKGDSPLDILYNENSTTFNLTCNSGIVSVDSIRVSDYSSNNGSLFSSYYQSGTITKLDNTHYAVVVNTLSNTTRTPSGMGIIAVNATTEFGHNPWQTQGVLSADGVSFCDVRKCGIPGSITLSPTTKTVNGEAGSTTFNYSADSYMTQPISVTHTGDMNITNFTISGNNIVVEYGENRGRTVLTETITATGTDYQGLTITKTSTLNQEPLSVLEFIETEKTIDRETNTVTFRISDINVTNLRVSQTGDTSIIASTTLTETEEGHLLTVTTNDNPARAIKTVTLTVSGRAYNGTTLSTTATLHKTGADGIITLSPELVTRPKTSGEFTIDVTSDGMDTSTFTIHTLNVSQSLLTFNSDHSQITFPALTNDTGSNKYYTVWVAGTDYKNSSIQSSRCVVTHLPYDSKIEITPDSKTLDYGENSTTYSVEIMGVEDVQVSYTGDFITSATIDNGVLTVTTADFSTREEKTATITVSGTGFDGAISDSVTLNKYGPDAIFTVDPTSIEIIKNSSTFDITITKDGVGELTCNSEGNVSFSSLTFNSNQTTLTAVSVTNGTSNSLTGTINIAGVDYKGNQIVRTVNVTQLPYNSVLNITPASQTLQNGENGATYTANIINVDNVQITTSGDDDFITSTSISNGSLVVNTTDFTERELKVATITVTGTGYEGQMTSSVTLSKYGPDGIITVDPTSIEIPKTGSSFTVNITRDGVEDISATSSGNINFTSLSFNNDKTVLTVNYGTNSTDNDLTSTITITGTDYKGNTITQTVSVTQSSFNSSLTITPETQTLENGQNTATYSVESIGLTSLSVTTSGEDDFITNTSLSDGVLTVTTSDFEEYVSKTATITVAGTGPFPLTRSVTLVKNGPSGAIGVIGSDNINISKAGSSFNIEIVREGVDEVQVATAGDIDFTDYSIEGDTLTVSYATNNTTNDLTGTITLTGVDYLGYSITMTINVVQDGTIPTSKGIRFISSPDGIYNGTAYVPEIGGIIDVEFIVPTGSRPVPKIWNEMPGINPNPGIPDSRVEGFWVYDWTEYVDGYERNVYRISVNESPYWDYDWRADFCNDRNLKYTGIYNIQIYNQAGGWYDNDLRWITFRQTAKKPYYFSQNVFLYASEYTDSRGRHRVEFDFERLCKLSGYRIRWGTEGWSLAAPVEPAGNTICGYRLKEGFNEGFNVNLNYSTKKGYVEWKDNYSGSGWIVFGYEEDYVQNSVFKATGAVALRFYIIGPRATIDINDYHIPYDETSVSQTFDAAKIDITDVTFDGDVPITNYNISKTSSSRWALTIDTPINDTSHTYHSVGTITGIINTGYYEGETVSATFDVYKYGINGSIAIIPETKFVRKDGERVYFNLVYSDIQLSTVTSSIGSFNSDKSILTVDVYPNTTGLDRTIDVTVTGTSSSNEPQSATAVIKQYFDDPYLTISPNKKTLGNTESTATFTIDAYRVNDLTVSFDGEVEITDYVLGNNSLIVNVGNNPEQRTISSTITISGTADYGDTITATAILEKVGLNGGIWIDGNYNISGYSGLLAIPYNTDNIKEDSVYAYINGDINVTNMAVHRAGKFVYIEHSGYVGNRFLRSTLTITCVDNDDVPRFVTTTITQLPNIIKLGMNPTRPIIDYQTSSSLALTINNQNVSDYEISATYGDIDAEYRRNGVNIYVENIGTNSESYKKYGVVTVTGKTTYGVGEFGVGTVVTTSAYIIQNNEYYNDFRFELVDSTQEDVTVDGGGKKLYYDILSVNKSYGTYIPYYVSGFILTGYWGSLPTVKYRDGFPYVIMPINTREATRDAVVTFLQEQSYLELSAHIHQEEGAEPDVHPIWEIVELTAPNESFAEYHITTDGDIIYAGKAYRYPEEYKTVWSVNDAVSNYLGNGIYFSEGLQQIPNYSKDFYIGTNTDAKYVKTFYNSWAYEHTYYWLSDPIDNRVDPRQWLPVSFISTEYPSINVAGKNYTTLMENNGWTVMTNLDNYVTNCNSSIRAIGINNETIDYKVDKGDYVLYYSNAYGGWDALLVSGTVRQSDNIEHLTYKRHSASQTKFSKINYQNNITPTWTLKTGITVDGNKMYHLLESTMVYLHNLTTNKIVPVIVTNSQCEYMTYRNNGKKPYFYNITVEASNTKLRK